MLDLGSPEKLPDALRGEKWSFVQLPISALQTELQLVEQVMKCKFVNLSCRDTSIIDNLIYRERKNKAKEILKGESRFFMQKNCLFWLSVSPR